MMTVTLPLTPEEESKLLSMAEDRGISLDSLVSGVLQDVLRQKQESGAAPADGSAPGDREYLLELVFAAFDEADTSGAISEETFHRSSWYRE